MLPPELNALVLCKASAETIPYNLLLLHAVVFLSSTAKVTYSILLIRCLSVFSGKRNVLFSVMPLSFCLQRQKERTLFRYAAVFLSSTAKGTYSIPLCCGLSVFNGKRNVLYSVNPLSFCLQRQKERTLFRYAAVFLSSTKKTYPMTESPLLHRVCFISLSVLKPPSFKRRGLFHLTSVSRQAFQFFVTNAMVSRAMTNSSLVGITYTSTVESSVEILPSLPRIICSFS